MRTKFGKGRSSSMQRRGSAWLSAARVNAGLVQAQAILGHSSPQLTAAVYTHVEPADLRAAVVTLEIAWQAGTRLEPPWVVSPRCPRPTPHATT
jgi:integrase